MSHGIFIKNGNLSAGLKHEVCQALLKNIQKGCIQSVHTLIQFKKELSSYDPLKKEVKGDEIVISVKQADLVRETIERHKETLEEEFGMPAWSLFRAALGDKEVADKLTPSRFK